MCHSQIELERYFTGDLPEAEARRVRSHVDGCAECREALARLEGDKIRFLNVYPFEDFAKKARVKVGRSFAHKIAEFFRTPWTLQLYGGAAMVTALLLLMIPVHFASKHADDAEDGVRYKGPSAVSEAAEMSGASMSFLRMRDGEITPGSVSDTYREGDKLQFIYKHDAKHYAALFSIDNSGLISYYTEMVGYVSVPADSGSDLTFPASVVLDDSAGEELIVAILSESPVVKEDIVGLVKLAAGGDFSDLGKVETALLEVGGVVTFRLKKE